MEGLWESGPLGSHRWTAAPHLLHRTPVCKRHKMTLRVSHDFSNFVSLIAFFVCLLFLISFCVYLRLPCLFLVIFHLFMVIYFSTVLHFCDSFWLVMSFFVDLGQFMFQFHFVSILGCHMAPFGHLSTVYGLFFLLVFVSIFNLFLFSHLLSHVSFFW